MANVGQLLTLRGEAVPRRGRDLQEVGLVKMLQCFVAEEGFWPLGRNANCCVIRG